MTQSKLSKAVRLALLPLACVSLLSACAYDPVTGYPIVMPGPVSTVDNPDILFDRLDTNRDGHLSRGELDVLRASERPVAVTPENVTAAYQRLDVDRDGFLSRAEAAVFISTVPGATFDQIDANRDGFLSMAEAGPHLRWIEARSPQVAWFDQYDMNRDGFLSRAEAMPILRSTRFVAGRWEMAPLPPVASFDQLDVNRDGYLSRAEAAPLLAGPATFDQYDVNRDGFLSRAEADVWMRSGVGVTYPPYGSGAVYGPR